MKKINVAVVGAGRIAGHHCRNIHANENLNLVAISDMDLAKAQAYGTELGVPVYANYREMFEKHPEIDLVTVATPSGMHFEHAEEFIVKYKKSVVVEKPTFLKLSHLKKAYSLAKENGVNVFPVFQNRYNLAVKRVKQALNNGELGDLQIITVRVRWCRPQKYYDLSPWRGTFAMDGGAISNQGIHHIDLLRHIGGEVEEVTALMRTFGSKIEVEDTCVSTLKFKNGSVGTLEVTTAARPDDFEASISVVGSKGLAQIGGIAVNELQIFTPDKTATKDFSEDFSSCVYGNGHKQLYTDIVAHYEGKKSFPINFEDCKSTLSLLHSFYVSNEESKTTRPDKEYESKRLGEHSEELANLYRI